MKKKYLVIIFLVSLSIVLFIFVAVNNTQFKIEDSVDIEIEDFNSEEDNKFNYEPSIIRNNYKDSEENVGNTKEFVQVDKLVLECASDYRLSNFIQLDNNICVAFISKSMRKNDESIINQKLLVIDAQKRETHDIYCGDFFGDFETINCELIVDKLVIETPYKNIIIDKENYDDIQVIDLPIIYQDISLLNAEDEVVFLKDNELFKNTQENILIQTEVSRFFVTRDEKLIVTLSLDEHFVSIYNDKIELIHYVEIGEKFLPRVDYNNNKIFVVSYDNIGKTSYIDIFDLTNNTSNSIELNGVVEQFTCVSEKMVVKLLDTISGIESILLVDYDNLEVEELVNSEVKLVIPSIMFNGNSIIYVEKNNNEYFIKTENIK